MSIDYEVASEVLAYEDGRLTQALLAEEKKENPSPLLLKYYNARIQAVADLQYHFRSDKDGITQDILNLKHIFGCRGDV